MSHTRCALAFFCSCILLCAPSLAQTAQITPTPQRDPESLATLNQCVIAAGGVQALDAIRDFTGSGSITYFWAGDEVQGSLTVRGRGTGLFRLDAVLSSGTRSWAISDSEGALKEQDGTTQAIPFHNAVNLGSFTFPYPTIIAALRSDSTSVTNMGEPGEGNLEGTWTGTWGNLGNLGGTWGRGTWGRGTWGQGTWGQTGNLGTDGTFPDSLGVWRGWLVSLWLTWRTT